MRRVGKYCRMNEVQPVLIVLVVLVKLASSRNNMLPHMELNTALTCRLIAGLTREQKALCHEAPDTTAVAFEGLQLAVKECQHQFRWHRWNCSSLLPRSANPHATAIMRRGFRETSFLYALSAAGVAHAVARACAQGRLLACDCDTVGYRARPRARPGQARPSKWEWSGCSHNLAYGIQFSKRFLDVREQVDDLQSKINVHNNNAGRMVLVALSFYATGSYQKLVGGTYGTLMSQQSVSRCIRDVTAAFNHPVVLSKWIKFPQTRQERDIIKRRFFEKFHIPSVIGCIDGTHVAIIRPTENEERFFNRKHFHSRNVLIILSSHMEVRCKCHGLSGSCQVRTCWRATPDFRVVASTIKREYRKALIVAQEELNDGFSVLRGRPRGKRRSKARPAPKTSLLFYERSPSFCEADPKLDSAGTSGRVCRAGKTSRTGSCDLLCCGRGHNLIRKSSIKPCNCTFHWCCRVDCQRCHDDKWIAICK